MLILIMKNNGLKQFLTDGKIIFTCNIKFKNYNRQKLKPGQCVGHLLSRFTKKWLKLSTVLGSF